MRAGLEWSGVGWTKCAGGTAVLSPFPEIMVN
jgi:hypothetical protein